MQADLFKKKKRRIKLIYFVQIFVFMILSLFFIVINIIFYFKYYLFLFGLLNIKIFI